MIYKRAIQEMFCMSEVKVLGFQKVFISADQGLSQEKVCTPISQVSNQQRSFIPVVHKISQVKICEPVIERLSQQQLKFLSDDLLLASTKRAVKEEVTATAQVLEHLREINSRLMHSKMAYRSLHEFCVRELGYSDGSAHRRIAALRLTDALPEIKSKIESGELTLTAAAQVHDFFRVEKNRNQKVYTREEKLEVLSQVQGLSKRSCEKVFATISPDMSAHRPDSIRAVSGDETEVRFIADDLLMNKLEKIKNLLSHKNPNPKTSELLHMMADLVLKQVDPEQKKLRVKPVTLNSLKDGSHEKVGSLSTLNTKCDGYEKIDLVKCSGVMTDHTRKITSPEKFAQAQEVACTISFSSNQASPDKLPQSQEGAGAVSFVSDQVPSEMFSQSLEETMSISINSFRASLEKFIKDSATQKYGGYVTPSKRSQVWKRDQARCTHLDPISHRRCESRFLLEIDHITPVGLGGDAGLENLRLLCRAHNQFAAVQVYGKDKMRSYMNRTLV